RSVSPRFLRSLFFLFSCYSAPRHLHSFPTRRSSDLFLVHPYPARGVSLGVEIYEHGPLLGGRQRSRKVYGRSRFTDAALLICDRSEEHTSELQSRENLVCRLLLEKKKKNINTQTRDI